MPTLTELHQEALVTATAVINDLPFAAWEEPSQCTGWSVRDLVRHMVGQNFGFAVALGEGDAPSDAYAPREVEEWASSVDKLERAVREPAATIRLAEVRPHLTFSPETVLGMHLLDTVVHTWDICGPPWRPGVDVADEVLEQARRIPDTARGGGRPFSAAIDSDAQDHWHRALRLLGRDPGDKDV